ncbi:hypothetical protein [Candidatus Tisiphia endosymbiont of Ditula angustiorana]|uniref:hypothetical protein n=1 Tax=Candidatus Tisiphia endosymbiont of Ditula angustiorana TaxID=3066272 RepID=UPI00312C87FE
MLILIFVYQLFIYEQYIYSNDLENGSNKQGVSECKQYNKIREYANFPIVFAESNSSKQKSISEYDNLQGWLLSKFQDIISMQQIDEQKLLQFEREIFLELAKNPRKIFGF